MCTPVLTSLQNELSNLEGVLKAAGEEIYTRPSVVNSGSTIGQHCRHILELIECLFAGYATKEINYDNRKRDRLLETDIRLAYQKINEFCAAASLLDCSLDLVGKFGNSESYTVRMQTTYLRELAYNLEHTVHHLALIKTALVEFGIPVMVPGFGVAYSTQQYRLECAP
jgi:hypothetical protein